jgi:hypothetical protein
LELHVIQGNYCKTTGSYFLEFLRLYVYRYLSYCIYVWSGINEILINYDRYLVLSNKTNIFNRKNSFKIITFSSGFLSFLLFVPNLVAYKINLVTNQTDSYFVSKTQFGNTSLYQLYVLFILAVSNILSTLFLILTSAKLALEANFWYILGVIVLNSNIFVLCIFNNKFRLILFLYARGTFIADSILHTN